MIANLHLESNWILTLNSQEVVDRSLKNEPNLSCETNISRYYYFLWNVHAHTWICVYTMMGWKIHRMTSYLLLIILLTSWIHKLQYQWNKCVKLRRNFVERQTSFGHIPCKYLDQPWNFSAIVYDGSSVQSRISLNRQIQWEFSGISAQILCVAQNKNNILKHKILFYHIYQPLHLGRIWHKVNFEAEFNKFEFRVFLLFD